MARHTPYITIFRVKNSDIGLFYGMGETPLCSRSNPAHHTKMSQSRVSAEIQTRPPSLDAGAHLSQCLVYIDLNMVRAGVVSHPSKWSHGGYNEIQIPRRKNVIIAYDRLRQLAGFKDYESFVSVHRQWVHDAIMKNDDKRDSRWSESVAVGSIQFAERVKNVMGTMARGRCIRGIKDGLELRESQSNYNAIFDPENCDIVPGKT